jgi:hypothetical protein
MQDSLGKIVVAIPGQPQRATKNRADPTAPFYVHGYALQRLKSNVGDVYVSLSPIDDRINLTKILCILSASQPSFSAGIGIELNGTDMSCVYIDADNGGDGVTGAILIS